MTGWEAARGGRAVCALLLLLLGCSTWSADRTEVVEPIHELLRINLDEPEASRPSTSLLPGADFTEKTISRRKEKGADLANQALNR